jgi:hypothetical protein
MNEVTGRDRMVGEARKLVEQVDGGRDDVDPRIVVLCRRMVELHEESRKAVRDAVAVLADPQEIAGPRHNAEERAAPHLDRLHEANRQIDAAGAELARLVVD